MRTVFPERNKARKRGYERSYAADIYADQKGGIVARKLRQKNCRRHVTDYLAGKHAEQQGVETQKMRKEVPHGFDARHITRKDKKEHEREQKGIVHLCNRFPIGDQQND